VGLTSIPEDIEEQRALFTPDRVDRVATKIVRHLSCCRTGPSSRQLPISLAEWETMACSG